MCSMQVRIEQVIVAEPGAVLLYKLSNLLKFYHHTIRYVWVLPTDEHARFVILPFFSSHLSSVESLAQVLHLY